jgi:hypothetical protein
MPNWLSWWGEQDEQATVNVAELLEQIDRQRAIIEEQARQIEAWKVKGDEWAEQLAFWNRHFESFGNWLNNIPRLETKEVTE